MDNNKIKLKFKDGVVNTVEDLLKFLHDDEELGQHVTKTSLEIIEVMAEKIFELNNELNSIINSADH